LVADGIVQGDLGRFALDEHPRKPLVKYDGVKPSRLTVHLESAFDRNNLGRIAGFEHGPAQKVLADVLFGGSGHPIPAKGIPEPTLGVGNKVGVWPDFVLHRAKVM
jgi:hypothetical protein